MNCLFCSNKLDGNVCYCCIITNTRIYTTNDTIGFVWFDYKDVTIQIDYFTNYINIIKSKDWENPITNKIQYSLIMDIPMPIFSSFDELILIIDRALELKAFI